MSQEVNPKVALTISGTQSAMETIQNLPSSVQNELCQKVTAITQEILDSSGVAHGNIKVTLADNQNNLAAPSNSKYDASAHLVQLISADFEGTLYPFATALGHEVQEYLKQADHPDRLKNRLDDLNMEMHQFMTEVARRYARTGQWQ